MPKPYMPFVPSTDAKYLTVPAILSGYEIVIGYDYSTGQQPLYSFKLQKTWPCEDGIYEMPQCDLTHLQLHVFQDYMLTYVNGFTWKTVVQKFGL